MKLHEYQAKQILSGYDILVPEFMLVDDISQVATFANDNPDCKVVVKAQVHAGGRGKAGGVKLVNNAKELVMVASQLLGKRLLTKQTDSDGQPINKLILEQVTEIKEELYLAITIDRSTARVVIMVAKEGGMNIEDLAATAPEKITKVMLDPCLSVLPYHCRKLGFALQLNASQLTQFTHLITQLVTVFYEHDLSLLEINPLVIDTQDQLICLDAKMSIDDNAMFRHPNLQQLYDASQENKREQYANKWDLNYIALSGNIGCMVNGAGLAMATMDIIKLYGAEPANFLDVGGSATQERVKHALKIILQDNKVQGILINIFGGIVKCDLIALGIIDAVKEMAVTVPMVVRLVGNNATIAQQHLVKSGLNILSATSLSSAAEKIVAAIGVEQ